MKRIVSSYYLYINVWMRIHVMNDGVKENSENIPTKGQVCIIKELNDLMCSLTPNYGDE